MAGAVSREEVPGWVYPEGSARGRFPGGHRGGFRRLPCLRCQPRSATGGRCKTETLSKLGKSDTIPLLTRSTR